MTFFAKEFHELTAMEVYEILKSRAEIFIMEQRIMYLDMDDIDYQSLHCFMTENGRVVAYLRAFYKDDEKKCVRVGRVLTLEHGKGYGKRLLVESIPAIKERMNCETICMDAQKHAVGFYKKFGFDVTSDDFLEEGIVHVAMEMKI